MKPTMRAYRGPDDFIRVRNFLKQAYYAFGAPANWGFERWNWGRHHPMVYSGDVRSHIRHFEESIRLWETEGRIVAMLNTENPEPNGEAWVQRLSEADPFLDEILSVAEGFMGRPSDGLLSVEAYDHDVVLTAALRARGFEPSPRDGYFSEIAIEGEEPVHLPEGFRIRTMADPGSRADYRCEVMGRGFNHEDPADWSKPEEYAMVQTAPDYRPEHDIVAEGQDGRYRSLCIIWYDDLNRFGVFEPVCTHPDFRRMGLGRAVIREGLNRLYRMGARKAYVGSGQDFYAAIGFQRLHVCRNWTKKGKRD
jgi:GNAT superfamily N-acetyltransferase